MLLLSERLGARERENRALHGAERGEAASRNKAEGLGRELQQERSPVDLPDLPLIPHRR